MSFERNVFVNCPFDEGFYPLLRPLLFTIIYLGFTPRIASESLDSGRPRLEKIFKLIEDSMYAIHDLSRIKSSKKGEYFRLNMPFEIGVDVGCRVFKNGKWKNKKCLILEAEKYRYQTAISDLSNSDIGVHKNEPQEVVTQVRNWLHTEAGVEAPGPSRIWGAFMDFMAMNYDKLIGNGFSKKDIEALPVSELMNHMKAWVTEEEKYY